MILPDVNVLIEAFRAPTPQQTRCAEWLDTVVNGDAAFGISPMVLSSVIRILTDRRIYNPPDPLGKVLAFADILLDQPHCQVIRPGPQHWRIFCDLCRQANATGGLVPDAWLAALAIESGCELITLDRDFRRFDGLRFRPPI